MAKRAHAPILEVVEPVGDITDAPAPIPVKARVRWIIAVATDWTIIDDAWAMAWTKQQVLVFWRSGKSSTTAWLRADQVRRR